MKDQSDEFDWIEALRPLTRGEPAALGLMDDAAVLPARPGFDLVISEYGASNWCDPYAWIPEAARVLRPGGELVFLVNAVQAVLTWPEQDDLPATETLQRPYFGMHRFQWRGESFLPADCLRMQRCQGHEIE